MHFMSHSFEKLKIQEVNTIWMFSTSSHFRTLHVNEHIKTIHPLLQINFYIKNANVSNKYVDLNAFAYTGSSDGANL
jgi:hypothetical protein